MNRTLLLAGITLILCACSSGSLQTKESFQKDGFSRSFQNVLVVTSQTAGNYQDILSDEGAAALEAAGTDSVAQHELFKESRIDRKLVRRRIEGRNIDAVLVFRVGAISMGSRGRPSWADLNGNVYELEDELSYLYSLGGNAPPVYRAASGTIDLWAELYDVASEELVWAVVLESYNPPSRDAIVKGVTKRVARMLKRDGLIR